MKQYIGLLLFFVLGFLACKKETSTSPAGKTALEVTIEQIRQKWTFDKFIHHETIGAQFFADTIIGVSGDYFDFKADNRVYSFWDNVHDTMAYLVYDKSHLVLGGDTFSIQKLQAASFIITNESATPTSTEYNEVRLIK